MEDYILDKEKIIEALNILNHLPQYRNVYLTLKEALIKQGIDVDYDSHNDTFTISR